MVSSLAASPSSPSIKPRSQPLITGFFRSVRSEPPVPLQAVSVAVVATSHPRERVLAPVIAQSQVAIPQIGTSVPKERSQTSSQVQPSAKSSVPAKIPSIDAPSYAERFKASLRNLRKIASPVVEEDGIPVVQAPKSVLLQTANLWKGHLVAHFHGLIPPPGKLFSDLNPAWGKYGDITIRMVSDTSCLIWIPCLSTREWVLQVGYWQAGNCAFTVHPWSSEGSLVIPELATAPIWTVLRNVPPQMYSLDGLSVIASAIGEPLHTEKSRLDPFSFGDTKVKVEICLDSSPPTTIIVRDSEGNKVRVGVSYPRLPPKCCNCGRFGHLLNRCQKPLRKKGLGVQRVEPFVPGGVAVKDTKISLAPVEKKSSLQLAALKDTKISLAPVERKISVEMVAAVRNLPLVPEKFSSFPVVLPLGSSLRTRSRSRGRGRSVPRSEVRLGADNSVICGDSLTVDHRVLGGGSKEVVCPRSTFTEFQLNLKVPHKGQSKGHEKVAGGLVGVGSLSKQNLFSAAVRKQAMRKQNPLKGYSKKADKKGSDFIALGASSSATQVKPLGSDSAL